MPDTNPPLQAWDLPSYSAVRAEHLAFLEQPIAEDLFALSSEAVAG